MEEGEQATSSSGSFFFVFFWGWMTEPTKTYFFDYEGDIPRGYQGDHHLISMFEHSKHCHHQAE